MLSGRSTLGMKSKVLILQTPGDGIVKTLSWRNKGCSAPIYANPQAIGVDTHLKIL